MLILICQGQQWISCKNQWSDSSNVTRTIYTKLHWTQTCKQTFWTLLCLSYIPWMMSFRETIEWYNKINTVLVKMVREWVNFSKPTARKGHYNHQPALTPKKVIGVGRAWWWNELTWVRDEPQEWCTRAKGSRTGFGDPGLHMGLVTGSDIMN